MTKLDDVIAAQQRRRSPIWCRDGFEISVQASAFHYCLDANGSRQWDDRVPPALPYTAVECGFPSQRPEPWAEWERFAESPDDPCESVYRFVPVAMVRALLDLHGGEV